ncbi:MAG: tryptophan 2,3-dioxygenase family protein [Polyangiaceae bacterium]|jgi:tryptophan 2,3-dioxygenase|nr:tryptophan 2,3-dioxygenase family protein [Polyangiaceae bacterium]
MKRVSYWDYIAVEPLLKLQGGVDGDEATVNNDELLFIVVHQVYELWFKLMLRELTQARDFFRRNPVPDHLLASSVRALRRVSAILAQAVSHFELIETLTTRDFLAFRDRLVPASGFQSGQMREIEVLLGLEEQSRISLGTGGSYLDALKDQDHPSPAHQRVTARLAENASLREVLDEWLFRTPIDGSSPGTDGDRERVQAFLQRYLDAVDSEARRRLQEAAPLQTHSDEATGRLQERYRAEIAQARAFLFAEDVPEEQRARQSRIRAALVFIESYRDLPLLAWPREVVDTIVELEQRFLLFRQRHARMVERVIGRRIGTGGSSGVDYLDQTALRYRIFRNFWAVRTILLRESVLPPLDEPETYSFRFRG